MTATPSSPPPTPSAPPRACQKPDEPWVAAPTPLGSHSQLIFKRWKESKMCSCVWMRFFLFLSDTRGGNVPSVVTSGHFPLRISLLYHLSPFFHFNELQAFETRDEIASAHVALWLPGMENDSSLSCCRCIFHRDRLIASVQICAGIKIAPASPD